MSITKYKVGIAHADTFLDNIGAASTPTSFKVLETSAGARTISGATSVTKAQADTGEVVFVGDIVKYINLFIQCGPIASEASADKGGWLEWAFVCVKETETEIPSTLVGTHTLGVIANHMFRNECVYTGNIPVGTTQPNSANISIKVPRFKQKIRQGDEWRFYVYWRATLSTSTQTDSNRIVLSFMYKCYS